MLSPSRGCFRFEDIEVDPGRRCVRVGGETVFPRPRAFDLLVYLIERRDRIVSREELLAALWPGTTVTINSLAQCVNEVRRTLGDNPQAPRFIRTAARAGYQFIAPVCEEESPVGQDSIEPLPETQSNPTVIPQAAARPKLSRRIGVAAAGIGILAVAGSLIALRGIRPETEEPEWFESAWWKLKEGAGGVVTDSVHGLRAAIPPGVSWEAAGSRPALRFSGRELKPGFGGTGKAGLPNRDEPRTLMAWIKAESTNGDSTPILAEGDGDPEMVSGFGLGLGASGLANLSVGHFSLNGKTRINDDRWHLIAGVYEGAPGNWMRLYVDGREESTAVAPVVPERASRPAWTIGSGMRGGTSFRGLIGDARLFRRALRDDEIRSLDRCMAGGADVEGADGTSYFFAPIHGNHFELLPRRPGDVSAGIRNSGNDFGGAVLVKRDPDCGLPSIHGARLPQDLDIAVELKLSPGPNGEIVEGGPFFRSRAANPGDGIQGGTSAGFWVMLDSTGQVRVLRLNPRLVLGFAPGPERFDGSASHELVAQVRGLNLQVMLDGAVVEFDVAGARARRIELTPAWETQSPPGTNHGAAGIVFGSSQNRGQAGGQEARNLRVIPYSGKD